MLDSNGSRAHERAECRDGQHRYIERGFGSRRGWIKQDVNDAGAKSGQHEQRSQVAAREIRWRTSEGTGRDCGVVWSAD